jgi:phage-related tail protein
MMDLEIADYERTVQALTTQVQEKDEEITEMKTEIERLEVRAKTLQEQIGMSNCRCIHVATDCGLLCLSYAVPFIGCIYLVCFMPQFRGF